MYAALQTERQGRCDPLPEVSLQAQSVRKEGKQVKETWWEKNQYTYYMALESAPLPRIKRAASTAETALEILIYVT